MVKKIGFKSQDYPEYLFSIILISVYTNHIKQTSYDVIIIQD